MNQKTKRGAFTLVELIIVVTILAILGTIAFISFQGYSSSARNAKRISDVGNLKTALALFATRTGRYPEPENITNITYLGAMVRSEGIMGDTVVRQLREIGKTPLDPLLETEYAYSLLNTKKEFEIGTVFEGGVLNLVNNNILSESYAADGYYGYIKGDYNGIVAKVSTGSVEYVLAVPSIIGSDLSEPDLEDILLKKSLAYNGYQNLPSSYAGKNLTMTGGFDFGGAGYDPLVYTGSVSDLSDDEAQLKTFGDNLQAAYSGSVLENNSNFTTLMSMNTSDSNELKNVAGSIVNNSLGGSVAAASAPAAPSGSSTYSCSDGSSSPYLCSDDSNSGFSFISGSSAGGTSVVSDSITGLEWQSNGTVSTKLNLTNAKFYCANLDLGGNTDWRLPDVTEYLSILDFESYQPAIDTSFFTVDPTYYRYWSSTSYNVVPATFGMYVHGETGQIHNATLTGIFYVRCVR